MTVIKKIMTHFLLNFGMIIIVILSHFANGIFIQKKLARQTNIKCTESGKEGLDTYFGLENTFTISGNVALCKKHR